MPSDNNHTSNGINGYHSENGVNMGNWLDAGLIAKLANEIFTQLPTNGEIPSTVDTPRLEDVDITLPSHPTSIAVPASHTQKPPNHTHHVSYDYQHFQPHLNDFRLAAEHQPSSYSLDTLHSLPITTEDLSNRLNLNTETSTNIRNITQPSSQFYFLPNEPVFNNSVAPSEGFNVEHVRRDFPALHQKVNGKPLVWLDSGATSQKPQAVIDAVSQFYENDNSNVHRGAHALAARATDAYEGAREKVQHFIGAQYLEEIIFVRGTTEGINLLAQTCGRQRIGPGDEIILTTMEHHANIVPWQFLAQEKGAKLRVVPITDSGEVMLSEYAKLLNPRTKIVALTHVSNTLGTVVPVEIMAAMARPFGAAVVIDGAQSIPHFKVNVQALDCDFFVFSGHKLFASTGIGVVYGKKHLLEQMPPWQGGGNMIDQVTFEHTTFNQIPYKFEAGTGNIAGAVGLGAAIDYVNTIGFEAATKHEDALVAYAMQGLSRIHGLRLYGDAPHKVGVVSFNLDSIKTEDVGKFLDKEGIAVRAGHHCAQPTMQHYGVTGMVRASFAFYNNHQDVDALIAAVEKAKRLLS